MLPCKANFMSQLSLFLYASVVSAFWRLPCPRQIGVGRVDPLLAPGLISEHAHTIHGGNNFGVNVTSTELLASNCTSCAIDEDRSAYWTPLLYFQHVNGSFQRVEQVGGMLAYYFNNNGAPGERITAFPQGFAMVSGDTRQRNFTLPSPVPEKSVWKKEDMTQLALAQKSLGFNCLHYQKGDEQALIRYSMPERSIIDTCFSGLRLEVQFPSCWNGKDVDSPNHKDHVKFPNLLKTGECPEGFKVRLPVLFYETIYAVADFVKYEGQYVLANGDPTGYGYHGDFINGWNVDILQDALDTCTDETASGEVEDCPVFQGHIQREAPDDCKFPLPEKLGKEDYVGPLESLPGKVAILPGPEYAPRPSGEPLEGLSMISAVTDGEPTSSTSRMTPTTEMPGAYTTTRSSTTSTYMENGVVVYVIFVEEEVVVPETVTVIKAGVEPPHKRHVHQHGRSNRWIA